VIRKLSNITLVCDEDTTRSQASMSIFNRANLSTFIYAKKMTSCHMIADGGDRRDVVPDSAFTVFRARVNAHLARAPTAL